MAKQHPCITDKIAEFINEQSIFFVATAAPGGTVNISPKGMDSFRILDDHRIAWLNLTGSGNETAAHLHQLNRMTIMFCAVSGNPLILRLYGKAREVKTSDADWAEMYSQFAPLPGCRQIFDLNVETIQTSCGMGVPLFNYEGDRDQLIDWAVKKGETGIKQYWAEKNQTSIDGLPTKILNP